MPAEPEATPREGPDVAGSRYVPVGDTSGMAGAGPAEDKGGRLQDRLGGMAGEGDTGSAGREGGIVSEGEAGSGAGEGGMAGEGGTSGERR